MYVECRGELLFMLQNDMHTISAENGIVKYILWRFVSLILFCILTEATSDLIICKLSDCTSSVAGGKEIILLCDKVTKGTKVVALKNL